MPPSGQHHVARREGFMTTPNGRVMFIAAHPDDPDFLAGGTVGRLAKEGREVAYVILTNGNKGSGNRSVTSEQLASIRAEEQRRAAQVLGVGDVEFLGYEDGELEDTRDLRRDVTREIRRWRPDLIITLNPHRTYNNFPGLASRPPGYRARGPRLRLPPRARSSGFSGTASRVRAS